MTAGAVMELRRVHAVSLEVLLALRWSSSGAEQLAARLTTSSLQTMCFSVRNLMIVCFFKEIGCFGQGDNGRLLLLCGPVKLLTSYIFISKTLSTSFPI